MKKRFEVVVFDWDGTLVDSIDWIVSCLQGAADACGMEIPSIEAAKNVIGLGLGEAMDALFPRADGATRSRMAHHYGERYRLRPMGREDLFDGVHAMLLELKSRGCRLAVATGKTRTGLDRAMAATRLGDLFNATRCADESASKPDPLMLNQLQLELDVAREKVLMVGDSIHDLTMAGRAGVAAVGVTCGVHDRETLARCNPLYCLPNTANLLDLLT